MKRRKKEGNADGTGTQSTPEKGVGWVRARDYRKVVENGW